MKKRSLLFGAAAIALAAFITLGCEGPAGPAGATGGSGGSGPRGPIIYANGDNIQTLLDAGFDVVVQGAAATSETGITIPRGQTLRILAGASLQVDSGSTGGATVTAYPGTLIIDGTALTSGGTNAVALVPENFDGADRITTNFTRVPIAADQAAIDLSGSAATGPMAILGSALGEVDAAKFADLAAKFAAQQLFVLGDGASFGDDVTGTGAGRYKFLGAVGISGTHPSLTIGANTEIAVLKAAGGLTVTADFAQGGVSAIDLNGQAVSIGGADQTLTNVFNSAASPATLTLPATASAAIGAANTGAITLAGGGAKLTVTLDGAGTITLPAAPGDLVLAGEGAVAGSAAPGVSLTLNSSAAVTVKSGASIATGKVVFGPGTYASTGATVVTQADDTITTGNTTGDNLTVGANSADCVVLSNNNASSSRAGFTASGAAVTFGDTGLYVPGGATFTVKGAANSYAGLEARGAAVIRAGDGTSLSANDDANAVTLSRSSILAGAGAGAEYDVLITGGATPEVNLQGASAPASLAVKNGGRVVILGAGSVSSHVAAQTGQVTAISGEGMLLADVNASDKISLSAGVFTFDGTNGDAAVTLKGAGISLKSGGASDYGIELKGDSGDEATYTRESGGQAAITPAATNAAALTFTTDSKTFTLGAAAEIVFGGTGQAGTITPITGTKVLGADGAKLTFGDGAVITKLNNLTDTQAVFGGTNQASDLLSSGVSDGGGNFTAAVSDGAGTFKAGTSTIAGGVWPQAQ
ncbi:MAG: hypothetical protein LBR23_09250 [Spirochaetaceae bacterium]|nr:hypothetical protein [Spirochaetaceae bacterium]